MKSLLLLGAASSFVFAFSPVASAQTLPSVSSASVALTCRSALDGAAFSQVQDIASPPCCYVSLEEDWYKENGIRIASIYQRSNGDTYRAESCELISEVDLQVDQTTTGGIGSGGTLVTVQPVSAGGAMPAGNAGVQPSAGAGVIVGGTTSGNTSGGNTGGGAGSQPVAGNTDGSGGGQTGGGNTGSPGNGNGDSGGDGNNGHGNDVGGFDDSNPGNSSGTANNGNNGGGNGGGHGGQSDGRGRGNNGFGNDGDDGTPNEMDDTNR